jgi:hypothetical protein
MNRFQKWCLRAVYLLLALVPAGAIANYTMTQGSGTTFGSIVVGGAHYVQMMLCDLATPGQCAAVDASGILSVKSTTLATAANQTTANTSLATIATNTGAAIPAGTALIGKVGIDQTTSGTTNGISVVGVNGSTALGGSGATGAGAQRVTVAIDSATVAGTVPVKGGVGVVNGGSFYQAVAASQTATVLQSSTGATGDYLSHCVIYPTSTSPGVVTVFDNTNTAATSAILFPGGSSSTSNLVPFAIPVGAVSAAGAWKVTTGSNVSVVCFGKFS